MKKLLLMFGVMIVLICGSVAVFAESMPQPDYTYMLNFENYKIGDFVTAPTTNRGALYEVVADPMDETNKLARLTFSGTTTEQPGLTQNFASPIKGIVEVGFRVYYGEGTSDQQIVQIMMRTRNTQKQTLETATFVKFCAKGLQGNTDESGPNNSGTIANTAFLTKTWYEVRMFINTQTERYEVYRIPLFTEGAQWERITKEGGYVLRAASLLDFDTYGFDNIQFNMSGRGGITADTASPKTIYYDNMYVRSYQPSYNPVVTNFNLGDNAVNVDTDVNELKLKFSDNMVPSTFLNGISISKNVGETEQYIPFEISKYGVSDCTIKLLEPLDFNTEYKVHLSPQVVNLQGIPFEDKVLTFTTEMPRYKIREPEVTFANDGTNITANVSVKVENKMETTRPLLVMFTCFDEDGFMVGGQYKKVIVPENTSEQFVDLTLNVSSEIGEKSSYKVYIWDGFNSYVPLKEVTTLEYN